MSVEAPSWMIAVHAWMRDSASRVASAHRTASADCAAPRTGKERRTASAVSGTSTAEMRVFMRAPGRIQFVHREDNRRKQKTQRRPQPLAANGMEFRDCAASYRKIPFHGRSPFRSVLQEPRGAEGDRVAHASFGDTHPIQVGQAAPAPTRYSQ